MRARGKQLMRGAGVAWILLGTAYVLSGGPDTAAQPAVSATDAEFFETRVRPVLAKNCYACHGPDQQQSALRVDSRAALIKGGNRGPSIVPGNADVSLLVKAIKHDDGLKMPIGARLKDAEIGAIEEWVRNNAPWPNVAGAQGLTRKQHYAQLAREHWAFQPLRSSPPPETTESEWSRSPIDRFILARLQQSRLSPAKPADKRTLIRRLNYVLTGLPPKAEDVQRFVSDERPDAYVRLVDRLLTSPHFGEQWARHWLDTVRFGETRGYEWNYEIIGAWRYRDYLVRALNADVPYDQLVREHIAGDLLEKPRINREEGINESAIGTAFYRLGEAGHDDCVMFREIALDVLDGEIDTLTKTFQGMTVSCARCHDHKLDPIPTEDYYGLYSVLNSSRVTTHTIDLPEVNASRIDELKKLKRGIQEELSALWKREAGKTARYMLSALPAATGAKEDGADDEHQRTWSKALSESGQSMDDPSYVWSNLACRTGSQEKYLAGEMRALGARYATEAAERERFNRENFEQIASFSGTLPQGWTSSGNSAGAALGVDGDFLVSAEGERALRAVLPSGFYTNLLSARLNGALRSPDLPKQKKYVSVRILGGNLGARRTVIDNCAIGENYKVLENDRLAWVRLDSFAKEQRLPVFLEFVTRWDNPRLPDRPDVLKGKQAKLLDDPRSYFGITAAVLHDVPELPKETVGHILPLFEGKTPATWRALAEIYQAQVKSVVDRWSKNAATANDVLWLEWLLRNDLLPNSESATPRLRELISRYRTVEASIPAPRVVEGLSDKGVGTDFPVLVGGNAKTYGAPAPRRFLKQIFGDAPLTTDRSSGRRELAEVIASRNNPLTARVMVNRIWQHIFGRGIVGTVDNFGVIGDKPSHPELLDYLAQEFVDQDWSIKKVVRSLVLSETFRQSGGTDSRSREVDPQNALLHHYPLRRLQAESIRDSILAASGKLRDQLYGGSVHPYRQLPQDYRRLFSGPLDGEGRRSLYTKVTRMEGTRFLETFDYPAPMAPRGSRDVTNVPAQALTLLNDPFVLAEAEHSAKRLLSKPAVSVEARVQQLFAMTLAREANAAELERFRGLALELASLHKVSKEDLAQSLVVWKDLAHTVFNLKEFIYIQ